MTDPRSFKDISLQGPLDQTTRATDGNPVDPRQFAKPILNLLAVAAALLDNDRPLFDHELNLLRDLKAACEAPQSGFNAEGKIVARQGGAALALDCYRDLYAESQETWQQTRRVSDSVDRRHAQQHLVRSMRDAVIDILGMHLHGATSAEVVARTNLLVPPRFNGPEKKLPLVSPAQAAHILFKGLISEPARTLTNDWSPKMAFDARQAEGTMLLPGPAGGNPFTNEADVGNKGAEVARKLFRLLASPSEKF